MGDFKKYYNPWDEGGEYWDENALHTKTNKSNKTKEKIAYITNNSNRSVYYKEENSHNVKVVKPNSISYEPLDGVATHKYCDKVFKVFTGATVVIDENGDVDPDYYGVGNLLNYIVGGWKGKTWNEKLNKNGDQSWNNLFEVSKTICK